MKIGKYQIDEIQTGTFGLDGGAMFGVVPKPLWEKTNPADDKNRIKLGARVLLLQSDDKKILIDTGIGHSWSEKFSKRYDLETKNSDFKNLLKPLNITTDEITDVILTHLHFDHVGGAVYPEGEKYLPTFANAKYHVQEEQFEWAKEPTEKDKGSFDKDRFMPLFEEGVFNFIDGDFSFDKNIELQTFNGHTMGQQLVKIHDAGKTLFYCADLIPTFAHIPMPFIMGFDIQPVVTLMEKRAVFQSAVEENWILYFEHDTGIACGTVKYGEKRVELDKTWSSLNDIDS